VLLPIYKRRTWEHPAGNDSADDSFVTRREADGFDVGAGVDVLRHLRSLRRRRSSWLAAAVVPLAAGLFAAAWLTPRSDAVLAAGDPVVAAAGDIACDPESSHFNGGSGAGGVCQQAATFALLQHLDPSAVLALGDTQYYCGGYQAYLDSYALSWGKVLGKTFPVPGNHESLTTGGTDSEGGGTGCDSSNGGAAGDFRYFAGAAKEGTPGQGWYSFEAGSWHVIALNSNCADAGGCNSGSPQYTWLTSDLAAHRSQCLLAFWHIPYWSSGGRAAPNTQGFVRQLVGAHADVILTGHDHIYERFALQNASGSADPAGVREFVVGTGGANHTSVVAPAANSEVRNDAAFGVLKLTLHTGSYDWSFIDTNGSVLDLGTHACHNTATPPTAPSTAPSTSTATPIPATTTAPPTSAQTSTAARPATTTAAAPPRFGFRASIAKRVLVHRRATLMVAVSNQGGSSTAAGILRIVLPPGLARAGRPIGPSCLAGRTLIACSFQPLAPGSRVRVRVLVRPLHAGRQVVHARVAAGANTATAATALRAVLPLRCTVPLLVGQSQREAGRLIQAAGCRLGRVARRTSSQPPGVVLTQHPPARHVLRRNSRVDIVVSRR
jgi:acid phosphatase type 7